MIELRCPVRRVTGIARYRGEFSSQSCEGFLCRRRGSDQTYLYFQWTVDRQVRRRFIEYQHLAIKMGFEFSHAATISDRQSPAKGIFKVVRLASRRIRRQRERD